MRQTYTTYIIMVILSRNFILFCRKWWNSTAQQRQHIAPSHYSSFGITRRNFLSLSYGYVER